MKLTLQKELTYCFTRLQKKNGIPNACFSKNLRIVFSFLLILSFSVQKNFAQLILDTSATKQQLVNSIIGAGYSVSNIKLNCPKAAIGLFTSTTSNIGISDGIVLSTGSVFVANGTNNNTSAGVNNGAPGDFDLDQLSGASTYDGCALEFDLVPACDTLKINYAFGSEEYPEYVNKQFNDVFGFFISGPGITGTQNIALVPGTALPVSINNINAGVNSTYFVNNAGGTTIQYDGFTKPLTAKAVVIPCETYHLKLVIADVLDGIFDSGVFIKGNTIDCSPMTYNDSATNVNAIKNCSYGSYTFCRSGDSTISRTVKYSFGGTAVNGIDYQYLPDSVVIPANQKCVTVNIYPIIDTINTGTKTVKVIYQYGYCPRMDTIHMKIIEPIPIDAGPNVSICSNDSVKIGINPLPNYSYLWQPYTGISDSAVSNPYVQLSNNGNADVILKYIVNVSDPNFGGCVLKDSLYVTVKPLPTAVMSVSPDNCTGTNVSFTDNSVAPVGKSISDWYWDFGGGLFDIVKNPVIKYSAMGTYNVQLTVTDNTGCKNDTTLTLNVWPNPVVDFSVTSACQGDTAKFGNLSTVTGGTILNSIWDFGDGSPLTSGNTPAHMYPNTAGSYTVKLIITSDKNCVNSGQKTVTMYPTPVPKFTSSSVCIYNQMKFANQSTGNYNRWDFGDGTTSTLSNPSHQYTAPGSYNIKLVTSSNYGCTDSITQRLDVYDRPQFDFTAYDTAGCPSFCAQFKSAVLAGSDSITTFTWLLSTGDIATGDSVTFCYDQGGTYSPSLVATSIYGCKDTISKPNYINVYAMPNADFYVTPDVISTYDPDVYIIDNSSPDVIKWWWDFGDGTSDSTSAGPFDHSYLNIADHTIKLKVQNNLGCLDSVDKYIRSRPESSVFIPNAFTPNDDPLNQIFRPYVSGIYETAKFEMKIFDRWGAVIANINDINKGWNGFYKGDMCQQSVYIYQIIFKDANDAILEKYMGTVTLIK